MRLFSCLALVAAFVFAGSASAQCHVGAICAAPVVQQVYAAPLVSYAPVVQLQQVVAPPAIVQQQQVAPVVQPQVQQVVVPSVPVLQYVAQPVVAHAVVQQVVQHHRAAIVVQPFVQQRFVQQRFVQRQFIVGNRAQRLAVVQPFRQQSLFQLNIGRRR